MMDLNYAYPSRGSFSGKKSQQNTDEKMHSSGKKPPISQRMNIGSGTPSKIGQPAAGFMDIMNQYSIPEADEDNYKSQVNVPMLQGVSTLKDKLMQPIRLHGTRNLEEEKAKARLLQD